MSEFPLPEGYLEYRRERDAPAAIEPPRSRARGVRARRAEPDAVADDGGDRREEVVDLRGRGGRGFIDIPEGPAEPPDCPIVALGHHDGTYHFIAPDGQKREFGFRELAGTAGQLSLFDGDMGYLAARWPRQDREGAVIRGDFNPKKASAGLMAMCADAGMWDPATPIRGRGVWRGPDDKLICHSGDRLLIGGADEPDRPAGIRLGAAVYPRRPALPAPATEPAPASVAREWKRDFTWWRFSPLGLGGVNSDRGPDGLAAELLFAAVSLALLGAAPRWRVHSLVKAVHGSGKSVLVSFIDAALGSHGVIMNNFSEAGFRTSLENEARPVLLDEAESDDQGVMANVIRVIRQMSGGEGVQGMRGQGGALGARHFEMAGAAFLFCINPPVLLPQDLSRFLVIDMLPAIAAHERSAFEAIERARTLSPALRARAFHGWGRFRQNQPLLRAALISNGCSTRQADLLGGLLAAGAMMTDDNPIDASVAGDLAESVAPLIETMKAEESENSDALRCWLALLSAKADVWRGGEGQTVGSMLRAAQDPAGVDARRALDDYGGMRFIREPSATFLEAPCLYVSRIPTHQFLKTVFRDTPWRDGGWATSLARLGDAALSKKPVQIGGIKWRAMAVPLRHLPIAGNARDDEAENG